MGRGASSLRTLTADQMAFVRAFIKTDDVEKAAAIVYPHLKNPRDRGNTLRKHPVISVEIERARAATVVKLGYDRADVLRDLTYIAQFDPKCLYDKQGRPKKIHQLTKAQRLGLVDHEVAISGDGTIRLVAAGSAKVEALKVLAKVNGMLDARKDLTPQKPYLFDIRFYDVPAPKNKPAKGRLIEHKGAPSAVGKDEEE